MENKQTNVRVSKVDRDLSYRKYRRQILPQKLSESIQVWMNGFHESSAVHEQYLERAWVGLPW